MRARDELARDARRARAPRVTLRFHPTTDDYERATGQPWFTSGAIVNDELHVLPLAVLRDRGVLDRTIRHELVHVLADAALGTAGPRGCAKAPPSTSPASAGDPAAADAAAGLQARAARRRAPRTTSCCARCRSARSATPTRERARVSRSRFRREKLERRDDDRSSQTGPQLCASIVYFGSGTVGTV